MPEFSFKRGERLSGKKAISSLFQSGKVIQSYPIRILYDQANMGSYPAAMAVSVPKRLFKRAVDRNLLKRRIREAYRLNKPLLYSDLLELELKINLVIQYRHSEISDFETVQAALRKALTKLLQQLKHTYY